MSGWRSWLRQMGNAPYIGNEDPTVDHYCAEEHGDCLLKDVELDGHTGLAFAYINQGFSQVEESSVVLLIRDRDRDENNQEDFLWCLPIDRVKWNKWYGLSEKFRTVTPKAQGSVRYVNRMEGTDVKAVIMMPTSNHTDDDALTACAWLRLVKGFTGRISVVRCTDDPITGPRLIARVAGLDSSSLEDVEIDNE